MSSRMYFHNIEVLCDARNKGNEAGVDIKNRESNKQRVA